MNNALYKQLKRAAETMPFSLSKKPLAFASRKTENLFHRLYHVFRNTNVCFSYQSKEEVEMAEELDIIDRRIDNTGEPHLPSAILVDVSASVRPYENEVNKSLQQVISAIKSDDIAVGRVEPCVITFNSKVEIASPFGSAYYYQAPHVSCGGMTKLHEAIGKGIERIQGRRKQYRDKEILCYKPWMFIITDGEPTDDDNGQIQKLISLQRQGELIFWPIAVGDQCNMDFLKQLRDDHVVLKAKDGDYSNVFEFISDSLSMASNAKLNENTELDPREYQLSAV